MTPARLIVAVIIGMVIFGVVCWHLEHRRERFVKSLLVGDTVQFQFENKFLIGTVTAKQKKSLRVYSGNRSYLINNDRVIRETKN